MVEDHPYIHKSDGPSAGYLYGPSRDRPWRSIRDLPPTVHYGPWRLLALGTVDHVTPRVSRCVTGCAASSLDQPLGANYCDL
jgi:hypothetical protein